MKLKSITNNIFEYLFIFLTILNFMSMYYRSPNKLIHYFINGLWELILLYLFIISLRKLSYIKLRKYINFISLYILIISISLIFYYFYFPYSLYNVFLYLINPILLIAVFFSDSCYLNNKLLIKFENVNVALSIVSLIFWLCYFLGINTNSSLDVAYGDIKQIPSYFNIIFFPQGNVSFLGINNLPRNSGMFSEPSMYAYLLCIAFLVELFINNKNDFKRINFRMIILFITILSTTSTTGIMIAGPALLVYLVLNVNNKLLKALLIFTFLISFIFLRAIMSDKASGDIESSYSIRMNDLYASFMAWKQHLFIGNGLGNDNAIAQFMYSFRYYIKNTGSSAGIPAALGYGGLIYASFYTLPNILSFKGNRNIALFSLFVLILNIFTNVLMSYVCIFVLCYLWAYFLMPNKDSKIY